MAPTPAVPTPRNPAQEFTQTARAYAQSEPMLYGLDTIYQPAYGRLNLDLLNQQMYGYDVPAPTAPGGPASGGSTLPAPGFINNLPQGGDVRRGRRGGRAGGLPAQMPPPSGPNITTTPGHHPGTIELATAQRLADIQDVARLGPAATLAYLQANPYLYAALNNLSGRLEDSPLLSELNSEAMAGIQSHGQLSPQEIVDLEQQSRAGFAQRGMLGGNQSMLSDALSRDSAVRQRQAAALQLGQNVQGLNLAQANMVGNAAGVFRSSLTDPFMTILGRPSSTSVMPTSQMFNPQTPYMSDLYNTNYNAQAASNIAGANNQAALWGGIIRSVGQVAGAAAMASDRRLKKNIKDTGKRTPAGVPIKTFQYRTPGSPTFRGVIAQDVEKRVPRAVHRLPGKKKLRMVDMSALLAPIQFAEAAA